MGYVDRMLARDEYVILESHRQRVFMLLRVVPLILLMILGLVLAGLSWKYIPSVGDYLGAALAILSIVPLVLAIYKYFQWNMERYLITNYRILQIQGVVNRQTFDSALEMVNDIQTSQSLFGRMFNYGDIHILTGSSESGVNDLWGIESPFIFKKALLEAKIAFGEDGRSRMDRSEFVAPAAERAGDSTIDRQPGSERSEKSEKDTDQLRMEAEEATEQATSTGEPSRVVVALNELRNAGVISDEEFKAKMERLTGQPANQPQEEPRS